MKQRCSICKNRRDAKSRLLAAGTKKTTQRHQLHVTSKLFQVPDNLANGERHALDELIRESGKARDTFEVHFSCSCHVFRFATLIGCSAEDAETFLETGVYVDFSKPQRNVSQSKTAVNLDLHDVFTKAAKR